MQVQFRNTKIEANGAYVYIKAFGREIFVKREAGQPLRPYVKRDAKSGVREVWGLGLYAVI